MDNAAERSIFFSGCFVSQHKLLMRNVYQVIEGLFNAPNLNMTQNDFKSIHIKCDFDESECDDENN